MCLLPIQITIFREFSYKVLVFVLVEVVYCK